MATRNRKNIANETNESNDIRKKSKREIKKAQREMKSTSFVTNKYGALFGIFILIFGIIYVAFFGTYIYKRKTGQTTSALNYENPYSRFGDMEALRNAIKIDENGKVVFTGEDMEKFKDILGESVIQNQQNGEENIEEVGNETEENEIPKEESPKEESPKEETPKENEEN
ncbi:hypothetical protein BCR36DRAFT_581760 [Piromyces finnis]|uniref:Uncharacterized protein n=1 Tax=Piromyces finnis TaxID=1754191 RepID=A0A1Y1VFJ9_9FUNG|nr:hypothetical protein BCR36DRAFT_581760 [Piromyces finnis]|eukprot:ORX54884.1 hypothetical protein BCR36DRAFT_581760 [Piromyces finnis]